MMWTRFFQGGRGGPICVYTVHTAQVSLMMWTMLFQGREGQVVLYVFTLCMLHRFLTLSYLFSDKLLRDVSYSLIDELSTHLNPKGRWKTVAGKLGFSSKDIDNFELEPTNATAVLLSHWGQQKGSTLHHLYDVLKNLRWLVEADIVAKYLQWRVRWGLFYMHYRCQYIIMIALNSGKIPGCQNSRMLIII